MNSGPHTARCFGERFPNLLSPPGRLISTTHARSPAPRKTKAPVRRTPRLSDIVLANAIVEAQRTIAIPPRAVARVSALVLDTVIIVAARDALGLGLSYTF